MPDTWLPLWLRLATTVALAVVVVVHLAHVRRGGRSERAWHAGHLVMALGMIDMLLPTGAMPVPAVAGEAVFAACTTACAAIGLARLRRYRPSLPWFAAAVGHAGMLCMFALPRPGFALLVWVLALCYGAVALGWATGRLPAEGGAVPLARPDAAGPDAAGSATARPDAAGSGAAGSGTAVHAVAVRVSLVVMALAMAYLLVAMQLAMPAGHHMTGM